MPYNVITSLNGLFGFLRRYGGILDEIIKLVGGFTTLTPGATNVLFSKINPKWKNVKQLPYIKEEFEFNYGHHLTVICTKERSRKFRLPVLSDFNLTNRNPLNIDLQTEGKGFTSLVINKLTIPLKKIQKLQILLQNRGIYSETLNINTNLYSRNYTPISVKTWIKRNILSKLGVLSWTKSNLSTRISDGSYLYDDVGSISEIEMLEIIKEVETINELRYTVS